MDIDLFEADDDEILSSAFSLETNAEQTTQFINSYPMLNCFHVNEYSKKMNDFSSESFVKNNFLYNFDTDYNNIEVEITSYNFSKIHLTVDLISNYVLEQSRMNIQILHANLNETIKCDESSSHFKQRKDITLMYHILLSLSNNNNNTLSFMPEHIFKSLKSTRKLLNTILCKETLSSICMASSTTGNMTENTAYHFLHGFLEWRFLDLLIIKQNQNMTETNEFENESYKDEFSSQYEIFMNDLIILSIYYFKKYNFLCITTIECFPCRCVKEIWLLLQFLSNKYEKELNFWTTFQSCINKIKEDFEMYEISKPDLLIFEIWLFKCVAMLEGYTTNGNFEGPTCHRVSNNTKLIENATELFLTVEPTEEQIRIFLRILMAMVVDWWNPKIDIPMTLWEYFHKRMNSSFYIIGSSPSSLAIASSTGRGFLNKMKSLLVNSSSPQNCSLGSPTLSSSNDNNLTSFSLFTLMLGRTVRRLKDLSKINQIQKILGRIFVKFTTAKFLTLNETGIHHLIELFIILVICSELNDVAFKLRDKLLSISLEKISLNRQICLTKGHIALITYFHENNIDISDYVTKLLEQLSWIKNDLIVSKVIIDGMCDILKQSENFNNGEHLFIDSWLSNFFNSCTSVEMDRILEIFHDIFEKIKINSTKCIQITSSNTSILNSTLIDRPVKFVNVLSLHILPFIKQSLNTTTSEWIPLLAADFCVIAAENDRIQFQKQFKSLLEATNCNKNSMIKFLLAILNCEYGYLVDSTTVIQIWLRSLVLLSINDKDVLALSQRIVHLEEFRKVSNLNTDELFSSKEPLCTFISAVGKNYETCDNFTEKSEISDKFNSYLMHVDKWIIEKNEKTDTCNRFYSFIALVIYNCSKMVYARSQTTCFFHIAMTRFILPCSIQTGKIPDQKLSQIVHKIWPLIVQGIGKLNFRGDPYITKTLTDLIIKWTPNFKMFKASKPFITCMNGDNEAISVFVFEKLATTFLTPQNRQPHSNAMLVITIFKDVLNEITVNNNENKMKIFIKSTIFIILEHLMMVNEIMPSNRMLFELLEKTLKHTQLNKNIILRDIISEQIKLIIIKNLSYYSIFCFQLLNQIAVIDVELIENILQFLKDQIKLIEEKRNGGNDVCLRNYFEKLQEQITIKRQKT